MHIFEIISVISISLLLLLASYLLVRGYGQNSFFRFIGLFFLLLAFNFADGLLLLRGYYLEHPYLSGWEDALPLLYGPTLLLFAESAANPGFKWSVRKAAHFAPFMVIQSIIIIFYQTLPAEIKQQILVNATTNEPPAAVIAAQLIVLTHFLGYTLCARQKIRKHQEQLKRVYSSATVSWVNTIYNYLILLFVFSLAAMLIQSFSGFEYYLPAALVIVVTTATFLFVLIFKALDQPILSVPVQRSGEKRLSSEEVQHLSDKIERYFTLEQGAADPDLSVKVLAENIGESTRDVSHVVNHHLANNFYDLVNDYRIAAAKQLLRDHSRSKLTITEVMFKVGFSSKSSFYTQFKQKTGFTPSAFRNQLS